MLQAKLENIQSSTHKEFDWRTTDNKIIFAQNWDAGINTRAVILLVHSFNEHSSRYANWALKLANEGISVLTFDFRGHGKSEGKTTSYNQLLNDVDLLIKKGKEIYSNKPIFLYGHSLGGNLIANYIISKHLSMAGVILTSPWFELTNQPPKILFSTDMFLAKFLPGLSRPTPIKADYLSRELKEVYNYKNDQLVHNKMPLGLLRSTHQKGLTAKRCIYKINTPLLIMHGSEDQITSCQASRDFVRNASKKTTYIEWKGCYHELHNDFDRDMVFTRLISWLNDQINIYHREASYKS